MMYAYHHRIQLINRKYRVKINNHIGSKIDKIIHYHRWNLEKMGNTTVLNIMIVKITEYIAINKMVPK
jgi:hypothetical protein